jgi:hypothetical protein
VSTIRFTLETPIILDSLQLRGRAVGHAAALLQIQTVRTKLNEEDEYHTLPGSGYDVSSILSSSSKFESPSSAATHVISARQRYRVSGLVKHIELVVQGNVKQVQSKEDDSILKKMDFGFGPLSPALDKTIHRTTSTGNRFTLAPLAVPKSESGLNDTGSSDQGGVGMGEEQVVVALFGFRLDSTPVASHVITLLNMATAIQFAAEQKNAPGSAAGTKEEKHDVESPSKRGGGAKNTTLAAPIAPPTTAASPNPPPFTHDLIELYQLTGLALMNSRSFVTAAEMFRKAKELLTVLVVASDASSSSSVAAKESHATFLRTIFLRLSSLDLLIADCLNENEHLYTKLTALQSGIQMLQAALGSNWMKQMELGVESSIADFTPTLTLPLITSKISPATDLVSGLQALQPQLVPFLLYHLRRASPSSKNATPAASAGGSTTVLPALQLACYKILGFVTIHWDCL